MDQVAEAHSELVHYMSSQSEIVEERLKSFLGQLQAECGILYRIVYKNKNQHRRCSYFQYLLKVTRDLKLLQSTHLDEILSSSFQVIYGKKPKQKVNLLESLKRRKCDGGKHNFMEQLLGAARLLSQMVEPMLKAATEISTLLARSFFMGFSLTILALLARLRVLVQQILLDVVSVFNMVSSLSQKEHSVKLTQEGFQVFREYYPTNEEAITLECVWETDKFVLFERINKNEIKNQDKDLGEDVSLGASAIQYQSIEALLGGDELGKADANYTSEEGPVHIKENNDHLVGSFIKDDDGMKVECSVEVEDGSGVAGSPSKNLPQEGGLVAVPSFPPSLNPLKDRSTSKNKVAFVSVKTPVLSTANQVGICIKKTESCNNGDKEDPFFNLLTGGNLKDSLF
uniref:Nucleolus and neural progenitor protein-like N-terminal domain-containing protein n=1 Tax=Davidia involucrata TaxID=16924 RepID=A0A5B6Z3F1_DAVIN